MRTSSKLQRKLASVWALLDERTRRLMAASEAQSLGYGGISQVRRACGLSRKAIAKGIQEIAEGTAPPPGRVRRPGAGRKQLAAGQGRGDNSDNLSRPNELSELSLRPHLLPSAQTARRELTTVLAAHGRMR